MINNIISTVNKIISNIDELDTANESLALFTGIGAIPVLKYMQFKYTSDQKHITEIHKLLQKIISKLNEEEISPNYCSGLAGIATMFQYILNTNILNIEAKSDITEALIDIDELLSEIALENTKTIDDTDFLHGSFGCALYLIDRIPFNISTVFVNNVTILFERLATLVIEDIKNSKLAKDANFIDEDTHRTNCGLAHGHISYILIFSKFLEIYPNNKLIFKALKGSVNCVLSFESFSDKSFAKFPGIAVNNITADYNIALGWCYGDQSISLGLYKAAIILEDKGIMEKAINLAYLNIKRNTLEKIFPYQGNDAGFCHGLSSVAYIHKKWYLITNDKLFYSEYQKYISLILNFSDEHQGFPKITKRGFEPAIGMLDGSIGVSMVLIDYLLGEEDLSWDKFFLLDVITKTKKIN